MKKLLLVSLLALLSLSTFSQSKGSPKFLGIPIDGTEARFGAQLKSKGFTYNSVYNCYKGQFNGQNVEVYLHTNHYLMDRVYVAFPYTSEESIRVAYDRLLDQFEDNGKYMDIVGNEKIPADDDISYEITVNNKRYQASYSYFDPDRDPFAFMSDFVDLFSDFFTPEQMARLKEYIKTFADVSEADREALEAKVIAEIQGMKPGFDPEREPEKALRFLSTLMNGLQSLADGSVWFMIHENRGRYQIGLYYDNLHNQAHGEDL